MSWIRHALWARASKVVRIAPPPPATPPRPLFHIVPAGAYLLRLFNPTRFGVTALTFNHNGPRGRFDHHHPPISASRPNVSYHDDPDRGIYYAGFTLSCCVVEVFGDTRLIDNPALLLARPRVLRPLRLLDLCGKGALRAGSVTALCGTADRSLSQAWSRHFYETAAYRNCDGLLYHSAHNNEQAIALYERGADALECPAKQVIALASPRLRPRLLDIAAQHDMDMLI